jgi:hypothetical protein
MRVAVEHSLSLSLCIVCVHYYDTHCLVPIYFHIMMRGNLLLGNHIERGSERKKVL